MIVNLSMSIHPWTVQNLGGCSQPTAYSSRHIVERTLYPGDLAFHHGTSDTGHSYEYLLKLASKSCIRSTQKESRTPFFAERRGLRFRFDS